MWGPFESEALYNYRVHILKSVLVADPACDSRNPFAWAIHSGRPYAILVSVMRKDATWNKPQWGNHPQTLGFWEQGHVIYSRNYISFEKQLLVY